MRLAFAILLFLFASSTAYACGTTGYVRNGYAKGQMLVDMMDAQLDDYIAGFVDGLLVSPLLGVSKECADQVWSCIDGRAIPQLTAITRKYLTANPEEWNQGANGILYRALIVSCIKD